MSPKERLFALFVGTIAFVIALDQLTKSMVANSVQLYSSIELIPDFLRVSYTINKGIIFGFLDSLSWVPFFITLLILMMLIYYYDRLPKTVAGQVFWALIIAGAVGNLIDRMLYGFVIDFIDIGFWPAFNIADAAITVGIIGLIIYLWNY